MDAKDRKIEQLEQLVEKLMRRVSELELALAMAKKDSSNSSKPPSSDIVKPPSKKRVRGKQQKRKRGAQKGHKRQQRKMLPPERVDETFEYDIDEDEIRRLGLTATDEFDVVQKIELRESPIHVVEHRLRVYFTPDGKPPSFTDAEKLATRFSVVHYEDGDGNLQRYDRSEDYFRFMSAPDVLEPTNNHCEQQIRHCVIDRRITQGTRSDVGQRYNERMWSISATCTKQARRFFDFLHDCISAHLTSKPAPALLG